MKRSFPCILLAAMLVPQVGRTAEPPDGRGLYAIWYGRNEDLLDVPYVVGGQIVVQWNDVEPQPGRYDFSSIARQLRKLRSLGKRTTIQINGNRKPDWLFSKVPYHPEKLSIQVSDRQGTLMYWHPVYRQSYRKMLDAFADFLAGCPDREALLGIRLNFDAIGTEHLTVPKEAREPARWIVPSGVEPGPPWSSEEAASYEKLVVDTYVRRLAPHAKVFVRNSVRPELEQGYRDDFAGGKLAWFHTSSEAEPRSGWSEIQYRRFFEDCRSGKTVAYAEPWASAWGDYGGKTDDRSCSPPQWNYWRLLLDLHCGVSYVAVYSSDLSVAVTGKYRAARNRYDEQQEHRGYQQQFDEAFRFAARYAGLHASPEASPGAWAAFRENHVALARNVPSPRARRLSIFTGDYNFLMQRLPDKTTGLHNVGPDNQRQGAWARLLPAAERMELQLDARFAASLQQSTAAVCYLDRAEDAGGSFQIIAGRQRTTVRQKGSDRWQTAELRLSDGPLTTDATGAHLTILAGDKPVCLHMVEVSRE